MDLSITTAEQFRSFIKWGAGTEGNEFWGSQDDPLYVTLHNDIDLAEYDDVYKTDIANGRFLYFDGQNHTVKNWSAENTENNLVIGWGPGTASAPGITKNLIIEGVFSSYNNINVEFGGRPENIHIRGHINGKECNLLANSYIFSLKKCSFVGTIVATSLFTIFNISRSTNNYGYFNYLQCSDFRSCMMNNDFFIFEKLFVNNFTINGSTSGNYNYLAYLNPTNIIPRASVTGVTSILYNSDEVDWLQNTSNDKLQGVSLAQLKNKEFLRNQGWPI